MKIHKWLILALPVSFFALLTSCDKTDTSKVPPKLMLVKPEYYDEFKSNKPIPVEVYAKDINGLKDLTVKVRRLVPDSMLYDKTFDLSGKTEYTFRDTVRAGVYLPHKTAAITVSISAHNEAGIERSISTQFNVNP